MMSAAAGTLSVSAQTVIFTNNFSTQSDFDKFTVVDYNGDDHTGDGNTWQWNEWVQDAEYRYSSTNAADDWLITPNLSLKKGYEYTFTFSAKAQRTAWPEAYSVLIGQGTDVSKYTTIKAKTAITNTDFEDQTVTTTVTADGNYRFAIRCQSDVDMSTFYVKKVTVTQGVKTSTPDKVSNLKVTPAPNGKLEATVSFVAPTTAADGSTLSSLSSIAIYGAVGLLKTIDNPKPGDSYSFTDVNVIQGWNTYRVIASNADGDGTEAVDSAYVGEDTPKAPSSANMADNGDGTATISWSAPSAIGVNNGYVDVSKLSYSIYSEDNDGNATLLKSNVSGTTYSVALPSDSEQNIHFYRITAKSSAGESSYALVEITTGEPYTLPYLESFAGGKTSHFAVGQKTGANGFAPVTYMSADDDGGSMIAAGVQSGETAEVNFGKISLKGTLNPILSFNYFAIANRTGKAYAIVRTPNGTDNIVKTINLADVSASGWQAERVELPAFVSYDYVTLVFRVKPTSGNTTFGIDAVSIRDVKANDLSISISAPASVKAGNNAKITATVKNNGSTTASSYVVKFFVGGKEVSSTAGAPVAADGSASFTYDYEAKVTSPEQVDVYAMVEFDGDENIADNTSETVVLKVTQPSVPTVNDLKASASASGNILSWTGITTLPETVTEDFESYDDFTISDFGPWTLYDGDKEKTWKPSMYSDFTNAGSPMAYIVFNPSALGIDLTNDENAEYVPHSGKKFAASMAADSYLTGNNDWLISEMLSGDKQTIKVFAKSFDATGYYKETFEVRYSSTGNAPEDFTQTVREQTAGSTWAEYSFDIPAGARYFAIVCTSSNKMMLQLDDITYVKGGLSAENYNIYRDKQLIATVAAQATTYIDTTAPEGNHVYNVTAVYSEGESALSNDASIISTGINEVRADGTEVDDQSFYNLSGERVSRNFRGIVIHNGKKYVRKTK